MRLFLTSIPFLRLAASLCHHGTNLAARYLESFDQDEYGYHDVQGALLWHTLETENRICSKGKHQSPIDLDQHIATTDGSSYDFRVDSYPNGIELENLGKTVQASLNGTALFRESEYNLVQFHFHTPSEHHLFGEYYSAELHFVFQNEDSDLAVIGFLIDIAGKNDISSTVTTSVLVNINDIPNANDVTTTGALDFKDLQAHIAKSTVYSYNGSLTSPPCSEGVLFNVVAQPLYVEPHDFKALKSIIKFNSRYTQNAPGKVNLLDVVRSHKAFHD